MKPIGILFESYQHFKDWYRQQSDWFNTFQYFSSRNLEWKLRGSEQLYIAVIPNSFEGELTWNMYYGCEFQDILGPDYKAIEIPIELQFRIRSDA